MSGPDDVAREQFERLYSRLQELFGHGKRESPFGWLYDGIEGDYWIVDDFHRYHQKIYIWNWDIFDLDLIRSIGRILREDFPQWDVMIQFDTKEMGRPLPAVGMVIRADCVEPTMKASDIPDRLKNIDFSRL